jgi:hypothetical protein
VSDIVLDTWDKSVNKTQQSLSPRILIGKDYITYRLVVKTMGFTLLPFVCLFVCLRQCITQ